MTLYEHLRTLIISKVMITMKNSSNIRIFTKFISLISNSYHGKNGIGFSVGEFNDCGLGYDGWYLSLETYDNFYKELFYLKDGSLIINLEKEYKINFDDINDLYKELVSEDELVLILRYGRCILDESIIYDIRNNEEYCCIGGNTTIDDFSEYFDLKGD